MLILDTHIWVWWVHDNPLLPKSARAFIEAEAQSIVCVSVISCWEVAKLAERNRIKLPCGVAEWINDALTFPGVRLVDLTPEICVESSQLPGVFHRDPADQLIVATARILQATLVTMDHKILAYPHVRTTSGTP